MTDRLQTILTMLEKNPRDVFLQYSLGMEYASAGRYDDAVAAFNRCLDLDEDYLAAHVEAGKCLRAAGKLDQARTTFAAAMDLAANAGEPHVRDYIRQQLEGLPKP